MSSNKLICRACLQKSEEIKNEHVFTENSFFHLKSTFVELTLLYVSDDDLLPKYLCSKCAELLEQFRTFKNTCIESDTQLRKKLIKQEILSPPEIKVEPLSIAEEENENEKETRYAGNKKKRRVQNVNKDDDVKVENKEPVKKKYKEPESNISKENEAKLDETIMNLRQVIKRKKLNMKNSSQSEVTQYKLNFRCTHEGCRSMFKTQERLDNHVAFHGGLPPNTCNICFKTYLSSHCLMIHHKTHFPPEKMLICDYCKKEFVSKGKLYVHIKRHVDNPNHVCDLCGKTYHSMSALKQHKHLHDKERKFKCDQCDKVFQTMSTFCGHRATMHSTEKFICQICNKQLRSKKALRKHCQDIHTVYTIEENLFGCNICDVKCKTKTSLINHQKLHTGERKFACTLCPKRFAHKELLKRHGYFHSGERPLHCEVCDKGFYLKAALDTHMNIHKRQWIAQGIPGITLHEYSRNKKGNLKNITDHEFAYD